jgi:dCTP deaminase
MAVEPHQWLAKHAAEFGYVRNNVGPASVDLRLHNIIKFAKRPSRWRRLWCHLRFLFWCTREDQFVDWREVRLFDGEKYTFRPGYFYLCSTIENIIVPSTHCAFLQMRSSPARKGLGHKMAGFIDPGFEGQITLELETHLPVRIAQGERIVQLVYDRLTERTVQSYVGRYKGQQGPTKAYN